MSTAERIKMLNERLDAIEQRAIDENRPYTMLEDMQINMLYDEIDDIERLIKLGLR